jgi:excisionase family DNA binding protein
VGDRNDTVPGGASMTEEVRLTTDDRFQVGAGRRPKLLTLKQVAEQLNVNERHVRRLVFERRIPYLKWGHLLRFDPVEVEQWLEQARIAADDPKASTSSATRGEMSAAWTAAINRRPAPGRDRRTA